MNRQSYLDETTSSDSEDESRTDMENDVSNDSEEPLPSPVTVLGENGKENLTKFNNPSPVSLESDYDLIDFRASLKNGLVSLFKKEAAKLRKDIEELKRNDSIRTEKFAYALKKLERTVKETKLSVDKEIAKLRETTPVNASKKKSDQIYDTQKKTQSVVYNVPSSSNSKGVKDKQPTSKDKNKQTDVISIKAFKCPLCPKRFTRKRGLRMHKVVHSGNNPHKCQICNKFFTRNFSLKNHMFLHTGKKPLLCADCREKFARSVYRNSHAKTHFNNSNLKRND